jgi:Ca-activated chloride channel family protein
MGDSLLPSILAPRLVAAALLPFALQFSAGVDLVEVYVSVTSREGAPVGDLAREDFVVLDNGVEQPIEVFARGDFPLSVVLAIDRSFSMNGPPLRLAREGAAGFLRALRPEDLALIVAIGTGVEAFGELSADRSGQEAALDNLVPWGTTSLHDAILEVLDRVEQGSGRRAVIILSDGQDRYSTATQADVVARVREGDVLVYGITLAAQPSPLFTTLADLSGGRSFHVTRAEALAGVFATISRELRTQYLLGYAPPPGPAGWRTIEVQVGRPGAGVRARSGYTSDGPG